MLITVYRYSSELFLLVVIAGEDEMGSEAMLIKVCCFSMTLEIFGDPKPNLEETFKI
jgi:hypothetical protein